MRTPRRGRQETKRGTHSSEVELAVPLLDAETPATAALISAAVASSTRSCCEMMQPAASLASSHVLPLPVLSVLLPGANVPVVRASCGSPPSFAISFASRASFSRLRSRYGMSSSPPIAADRAPARRADVLSMRATWNRSDFLRACLSAASATSSALASP